MRNTSFLSDKLDLQIKCTGSLHLSIMSSVPSVQPLDSHMHLEANAHVIWKSTPKASVLLVRTTGRHHATVPCRRPLFWCLCAPEPLVCTGMEDLDTVCSSGVKLWTSLCWPYLTLAKTWCHKRALLPGLQRGHGADMLGPLQDSGLVRCLCTESMSQICCWGSLWLRDMLLT